METNAHPIVHRGCAGLAGRLSYSKLSQPALYAPGSSTHFITNGAAAYADSRLEKLGLLTQIADDCKNAAYRFAVLAHKPAYADCGGIQARTTEKEVQFPPRLYAKARTAQAGSGSRIDDSELHVYEMS